MSSDVGLPVRVRSGLAWSTANNVVLRIGSLLVTVVVARLLAPRDIGVFAVALAVVVILGTFADLGASAFLVRSPDPGRAEPTVAFLGVCTSGALGCATYLAAGPIAAAFGNPAAAPVVELLSVSVALAGLSVVPAAALQREFQQSRQLVCDAANLLGGALATVVLVLADQGAMSLAWGRLAGQAMGTALQFQLSGTRVRWGWEPAIAREVLRFGTPLAGANVLSWLLLSIDTVVVSHALGPVLLGFYVLAFNVSSWPVGAVAQPVRVIALPAFSRGEGGGPAASFPGAAALTWAVALPVGLLLAVLSRPLVAFLYGERWAASATALVGLGLLGALRVLFDLSATFAVARGRTREVLGVQAWWVLVLAPSMLLAVDRWGITGAAWAHVVVAATAVLPAYLLVLRGRGVRLDELARRCAVPTACALPALLVSLWVVQLVQGDLADLAAGGTAFVAVYAPLLRPWATRQVALLSSRALVPAPSPAGAAGSWTEPRRPRHALATSTSGARRSPSEGET